MIEASERAPKAVLVTGATGFTGTHLLPLLLNRYGRITCFVRKVSAGSPIDQKGVDIAVGNVDDPGALENALTGKDLLINIVNLVGRAEHRDRRANGIIAACRKAGVRRVIFIGSTSIFTTLEAETKKARVAAEASVMRSGLDYTILRPTMIYGTPQDRNMVRLIEFVRRYPVIFVPGRGDHLQQPVHVDDLARAIVDCLEVRATFARCYNLSGANALTFNEIIEETCFAAGVRRLKIHVPLGPARLSMWLLSRLPRRIRITEEQILRLNESKHFDHTDAKRDFGFSPRPFLEGIRQEVAQQRIVGQIRPQSV